MKKVKRRTQVNVKKQKNLNSRGITLVALVLTVIIIIILATIAISFALGENGLINKAKLAKEMTANSMAKEEEAEDEMLEIVNEALEGTGGELTNTVEPPPPPKEPYVDEALVEPPQLTDGMTPVKYENGNWVKTDIYDSNWYDYTEKKWANVVLVNEEGLDANGDEQVFNEDGTLNEDSNYSMLVWIPRYAYIISTNYHNNTAGQVDIVFLDKENHNKARR